MKRFVLILLISVAAASTLTKTIQEDSEDDAGLVSSSEEDFDDDDTFLDLLSPKGPFGDENEYTSIHGLIISSEFKKVVKNLMKQMPCGWPEQGIPPLAPYRREEVNIEKRKSFVSTVTQLLRFKFDGLEQMKIKKLSISYIGKKVKFHFIFPKLQTTSKFNTDTFLDLMKELGISVRYEGKGAIDFSLIKLSIKGSFKYKAPLIWGSVRIYKFNTVVTLGDCKSNITGIAPTTNTNRFINNQIEETILSGINDNQAAISSKIEELVVPTVNQNLEGKNIWALIAMKPPKPAEKCVPPPDPWA